MLSSFASPLTGTPRPRSVFRHAFRWQTLVVCAVCAVIVAVTGPFGTYGRYTYGAGFVSWFALIYAVSVAIYAVSSLVIMVLRRDQGLLYRAATLVLGSLAGATVVRALLALGVMGEVSSMPGLPALTFYVGCIMVAIQVLQYVAPKFGPAGIAPHPIPAPRTDAGPGPAEPAAAPPRARLADRLGLAEGAHVLKVTADGHFIEVKTCSGTVRTRLRFSDALAELDGQSGIVTHRSHWVALMAIRGWMPHAAKPVIVLQDDTCVPISKTYKEAVAALGLPEVSLDASAGARAED